MQDLGTVSQLQQGHGHASLMHPPAASTLPRGLSAYTPHGHTGQVQQNTTTERLSLRPPLHKTQMAAPQQQPAGPQSGPFRRMQAPQFSSAPAPVRNTGTEFATSGSVPQQTHVQQPWGGGTQQQQQQQGQRFAQNSFHTARVEGSYSTGQPRTYNAPPAFSTTFQQPRSAMQSAYPPQAGATRMPYEYGHQSAAQDQFAGRDTRPSVLGPSRLQPTQTQQQQPPPSQMHQTVAPGQGQMLPGMTGQQSYYENQGYAPSQPTTNADRYSTASMGLFFEYIHVLKTRFFL